jgi:regulator of replication initiation timing
MSVFDLMLEDLNYTRNSSTLFSRAEEALMQMESSINNMVTELEYQKTRIDRMLEELDTVPINHMLSLKNNKEFTTPYDQYNQAVEDLSDSML